MTKIHLFIEHYGKIFDGVLKSNKKFSWKFFINVRTKFYVKEIKMESRIK